MKSGPVIEVISWDSRDPDVVNSVTKDLQNKVAGGGIGDDMQSLLRMKVPFDAAEKANEFAKKNCEVTGKQVLPYEIKQENGQFICEIYFKKPEGSKQCELIDNIEALSGRRPHFAQNYFEEIIRDKYKNIEKSIRSDQAITPITALQLVNLNKVLGIEKPTFAELVTLGPNEVAKQLNSLTSLIINIDDHTSKITEHMKRLGKQENPESISGVNSHFKVKPFPLISMQQSQRNEFGLIPEMLLNEAKNEILKTSKEVVSQAPKMDDAQEWAKAKEMAQALQGAEGKIKRKKKEGDVVVEFLNHSFVTADVNGESKLFRVSRDVLGKGGEGKVKIIEDELGNKFALKVEADKPKEKDEESKIMKEAGGLLGEFVRKKESKISKAFGVEIGDKRYRIMPLYPGKEIAEVVNDKKSPISAFQKVNMAVKTAEAVSQLHEKNIIHRDIKPQNFMVKMEKNGNVGEINIIDFGGALKVESNSVRARPIGTFQYMGPEHFNDALKERVNQKSNLKKARGENDKKIAQNIESIKILEDYKKGLPEGEIRDEIERQIFSRSRDIQRIQTDTGEIIRTFNAIVDSDIVENKYSNDIFALGKMWEKDFGLDLKSMGLEKMLDPNPDHRPNISTVCEAVEAYYSKELFEQRAENWLETVGNYEVEDPKEKGKILSPQEADQRLTDILGKENKHLIIKEEKETKDARENFIDFLINKIEKRPDSNPNATPTKLKDFLGPEGYKLYKAAIKEEAMSPSFRTAVFLKSTQMNNDPSYNEKVVCWVGGPSASGKSFSAKGVLNHMAESGKVEKAEGKNGNTIVSIDGGVERDVSQMRKMVLQTAMNYGFKGISDLHKETKLGIKKDVKAAAMATDNVHVIIPATFTKDYVALKVGMSGDIEKYAKDPNINQIFVMIRGEEEKESKNLLKISSDGIPIESFIERDEPRFQTSVRFQGESRAWATSELIQKYDDPNKIDINNPNVGAESKNYDGKIFSFGCEASDMAAAAYEKANKDNPNLILVTNDMIFLRKDEKNNWLECKKEDKPEISLSHRDLERWQSECQHQKNNVPKLEEWLQKQREAKTLSGPDIKEIETLKKTAKKEAKQKSSPPSSPSEKRKSNQIKSPPEKPVIKEVQSPAESKRASVEKENVNPNPMPERQPSMLSSYNRTRAPSKTDQPEKARTPQASPPVTEKKQAGTEKRQTGGLFHSFQRFSNKDSQPKTPTAGSSDNTPKKPGLK